MVKKGSLGVRESMEKYCELTGLKSLEPFSLMKLTNEEVEQHDKNMQLLHEVSQKELKGYKEKYGNADVMTTDKMIADGLS
jgi:hypothetical protein